MDNGLITFFEIEECGFYRSQKLGSSNKRSSVHVQGDLQEALDKVTEWAKQRDFCKTLPFDSASHPNRSHVYFKDYAMSEENGDRLIVFCKAFSNDEGKLSGFVQDSKVGSNSGDVIQVEKNAQGKKLIYGAPMYFWYIPEKNLVASIKFPHSTVNTEEMCWYIKRSIDNFIPDESKVVHNSTQYNHFANQDIDRKNVTYKSSCGKYSTKFSFKTKMKELTIDDISPDHLAPYITHLVIRETISSEKKIEQNPVLSLWNKVNKKRTSTKQKKHVEIIEEATVTADELRDILKVYNEENDGSQSSDSLSWNDIGFRTNDEDTTKWFSNYVDRRKITLDPTQRMDGSYYPAKTVMITLQDVRDSLLNFSKTGAAEQYSRKYGN
ncbi:hypothetical protein [Vibrio alginolyticus]|uniref:hypothetical protein n=2 Tax=Vibrio harveyi group TaxID=717610 RepID=UPI0006CA9A94|nr:hypothetical protein [Vibrio alginolyticus]KPM90116.1 hypothetical protein AOR09_03765 [Vibrio alginolyticus]KPM99011.1 hypothetical protein AOG25_06150 [Vibrio alginolyticus]